MRALLLIALCAACTSAEDTATTRPDFTEAPTLNTRITSVRFMTDEEVGKRLWELEKVGTSSKEAPVRDAVVLRLRAWGQPPARPILRRIYREDPKPAVSEAALKALRDLCWAAYGKLQPDRPPTGPIPDDCTPAYDGTVSLPSWRPPPRDESAAFWAAHDVPTKVLPSGEIWAEKLEDRKRTFARYPKPPESKTGIFDGL